VLLPAVILEVLAAVVFLTWTSLAGVIKARVLTGLAVGMITATATAHLAELDVASHGASRPRAAAVATAANLGGLGCGPLVSGLLAAYVRAPLMTPYLVFAVLMVFAAVGVALVPETVEHSAEVHAYRPQRVAVPTTARGRYLAVALAAFALFSDSRAVQLTGPRLPARRRRHLAGGDRPGCLCRLRRRCPQPGPDVLVAD